MSRRASRSGPLSGFRRNFWGIHDLHGLIWEWVADLHSALITILNAKGEIVHQQVGLNQDIQETVRLLGELVKTNRN